MRDKGEEADFGLCCRTLPDWGHKCTELFHGVPSFLHMLQRNRDPEW